jgi:hypothetical protein
MKQITQKHLILLGLGFAIWVCNGNLDVNSNDFLIATAEARLGRPATPVSYAGVARRSTVRRAATPGVGARGVGVRPGAGAGRAGVGANRGGPVNRVGIR